VTTAAAQPDTHATTVWRRPAVVYWNRGAAAAELVGGVARVLRADRAEHGVLRCGEHAIALFLAEGDRGMRGGLEVQLLIERVVDLVGARNGGARPRAIVGEAAVPTAQLAAQTRRLLRLRCHVEARSAPPREPVVSEGSLALAGLLEGLDRRRVADFVRGHIGALLAYDRVHGTDLARVLEIGLGAPSRDEAARAAHMHRNTFRRRLNHACALVGLDPGDGDQGLAVRLARRLARVTAEEDVAAPGPRGRRSSPACRR
jgi:hypothetical protein